MDKGTVELAALVCMEEFWNTMLTNVFVKQALCDCVCGLVLERKEIDIFSELIHDDQYVSISLGSDGKFSDISENALKGSICLSHLHRGFVTGSGVAARLTLAASPTICLDITANVRPITNG